MTRLDATPNGVPKQLWRQGMTGHGLPDSMAAKRVGKKHRTPKSAHTTTDLTFTSTQWARHIMTHPKRHVSEAQRIFFFGSQGLIAFQDRPLLFFPSLPTVWLRDPEQ